MSTCAECGAVFDSDEAAELGRRCTACDLPPWLKPGARVVVQSSPTKHYTATVQDIRTPWFVYLEGMSGAVHPGRILRLATTEDP